MKERTIIECLACSDHDHMCIRSNVPYICIYVESILGN